MELSVAIEQASMLYDEVIRTQVIHLHSSDTEFMWKWIDYINTYPDDFGGYILH